MKSLVVVQVRNSD